MVIEFRDVQFWSEIQIELVLHPGTFFTSSYTPIRRLFSGYGTETSTSAIKDGGILLLTVIKTFVENQTI